MNAEVRPAAPQEAPEGYEYVAVEAEKWRPVTGKLCRRMLAGYTACRKPSAAELLRPKKRLGQPVVDWWPYCEEHMHGYGKWIEDGKVMHWILRESAPLGQGGTR